MVSDPCSFADPCRSVRPLQFCRPLQLISPLQKSEWIANERRHRIARLGHTAPRQYAIGAKTEQHAIPIPNPQTGLAIPVDMVEMALAAAASGGVAQACAQGSCS
jgi:hypothetical protein